MTTIPVTLAGQGVLLEPDDADGLVDLLTDAATVIGHLAGHPAAGAAVGWGRHRVGDCAELTVDLRLAAARLDVDAAARLISDQITGTAGKEAMRKGKARGKLRKASAPQKASDNLNALARCAGRTKKSIQDQKVLST